MVVEQVVGHEGSSQSLWLITEVVNKVIQSYLESIVSNCDIVEDKLIMGGIESS